MKSLRIICVSLALIFGGAELAQAKQRPLMHHAASQLRPDWNHNAAFYEIFVRSYKDSDGDGIGDFNGITSKLDYLKSLGVTGIWLMPIHPSGDLDHGYAVSDYRAVNPDYGTMADFERLLAEAHKRGIGIIIDYVINHSSYDNPMFLSAAASKNSPYRDWYLIKDENPNWLKAKDPQGSGFYNDPWKPVDKNDPSKGYFYGIFDTTMPDMNLKNPKVVKYFADTMRFWMDKGVDGFRIDAVTMLVENGHKAYMDQPENQAVLTQLSAVVKSYKNRYLVCEASEHPELYVTSCLNSFAFHTQEHIKQSAIKGAVQQGLIAQLSRPNRDNMPMVLMSHDSYVGDRLINVLSGNELGDYRVAAAIAILSASTTFSYYGEEIGMGNNGKFDDPGLRAPMSWASDAVTAGFSTAKPYRAPATNVSTMNVASQTGDKASLLAYYTSLYQLRKDYPILGTGAFKLISKEGDPVLLFTRTLKKQQAIVAINVSNEPQSLDVGAAKANAAYVNRLSQGLAASAKTNTKARLHIKVAAKTTAVYINP